MKMNGYPEPSSTAEIRRCMTQTSRAAGATLVSSQRFQNRLEHGNGRSARNITRPSLSRYPRR